MMGDDAGSWWWSRCQCMVINGAGECDAGSKKTRTRGRGVSG